MAENRVTTAGALLIKHMMPTEQSRNAYDVHRVLDKGGVGDLIASLLKHGGPTSHETINSLGQLFFNKASEIGASTPLDDYNNDSEERHTLIAELETKVRHINAKTNLSDRDRTAEIAEVFNHYRPLLEKQNLKFLLAKGSTAAKMANTGARGRPDQLAAGTSSPLLGADVKGNPIPIVIKHSFAEGLSPAEHLAMSYQGRASTVLTQLSTALPGALFKKLTPNLVHEVVTQTDCGTKNGSDVGVNDRKRVFGHFEAGTNRLIDEALYKDLVSSGKTKIRVRSTLTCEAKDGICQRCYGIAANGKLPEIGENMGVIASQSASEVLTQAMLSTKHKTNSVGVRRNEYELADNLLNNPKDNFLDEATIAQVDGKIISIKETPLKDFEVYVGAVRHFVPRVEKVTVNIGDSVYAGDRLSTGTINPRKLAEIKGVGAARAYMSHELRNIYGPKLDPRHFDLIAKNMIKYVQVMHPGESGLLPGQKMTVNDAEPHLQQGDKIVPLHSAVGQVLSRRVFEMMPGTVLRQSHVDYLARHGIDKVGINTSGIVMVPIVPGLQTGKLLDKNWVSSLSFSRIKEVLRNAAAERGESDIHSTDPITPYVMGSEFGQGENGKY